MTPLLLGRWARYIASADICIGTIVYAIFIIYVRADEE
jgi:hypothetical protein